MSTELKIPDVGESVREVQIGRWLKQEGDAVAQDENLVELETDKASMELPAPTAGVLSQIVKHEGDTVAVGDVVGYIEAGGEPSKESEAENGSEARAKQPEKQPAHDSAANNETRTKPGNGASAGEDPSADKDEPREETDAQTPAAEHSPPATPAARRALRKYGLSAAEVHPDGPRIEVDDVTKLADRRRASSSDKPEASDDSLEQLVPMSLIRRRIGERLVEAQQHAALLTTFNEIDMTAVKECRSQYREAFQKRYNVKLGFMSFFVKAVVDALRSHPEVNAEIRGSKVLYRDYYHIGVAIGGERGLVVPVLRYAERLSFAEIELAIDDLATRAAANKLKPQELEGGTFTITNGGVYGSLLSTPIVNPPQTGVLGMHAIQDRPVARNGEVIIRPMMYVALTYDHRLIDGRGAVTFLRRIKETIEDPARMLLEI
jgi:2-oxoglutarate dehydrogenase E2 component (dihydrolipoamide succinyltransferase)